MTNQVRRERVRQGADSRRASDRGGEDREISSENFIRFTDWYVDTKPIASGCEDGRVESILTQPAVDRINGL